MATKKPCWICIEVTMLKVAAGIEFPDLTRTAGPKAFATKREAEQCGDANMEAYVVGRVRISPVKVPKSQ